MQHDFYQTRPADRLLQQKDIVLCPKIHRLSDNPIFGMGLISDRLPPQVFAAEFRYRFL